MKGDHLITVVYEGELERKRLEYILNRYSGSAWKVKGATIFCRSESFNDLYRDLYAKFGNRVKSYHLKPVSVDVPLITKSIEIEIRSDTRDVETFLRYLMAKRSGRFVLKEGGLNVYSLNSRKGNVKVRLGIKARKGGITGIHLILEGVKDAVEHLNEGIMKDLEDFKRAIEGGEKRGL